MPRHKNERIISFKPRITDFSPIGGSSEKVSLLPEEVEAIYLMDLLGLYQEDAAFKMEVSRPTFARIIKSARQKLAMAVLNGQNLHLQSSESGYVVAFCSNSKEIYENLEPQNQYICIFEIKNKEIVNKTFLQNPVNTQKAKPAIALPEIFIKYGVNFYITSTIGEGFKNSLISKGITIVKKDSITLYEVVTL
ncbi:DUF134 domain-containing protein [Arcobacter sp. FWKO B]|uniref:DUF134 domain-containing protein n=1 Tax=Arcobacter sp. FWKO B TaxID=2593672 RepID=UPI0018A388D8|nr:DUF134 domain-containing protein [Arcobacter sp. FWKO B]QOG11896.1 DUF134 domain-containing protein [Arcobacter sp. FWKO B]